MSVPRPESADLASPGGSKPAHRHTWSDEESPSRSYDAARFGALACLLFMAGGLYWTAAIGLLTLSALTAYPVMVSIGAAFTLMIFGATFWTPQSRASPGRSPWSAAESEGTSTYDPVTGLPLNRLFLSLLNQALIRAQKHGRQVALLMIELDYCTPAAESSPEFNSHLMYRIEAARVKSALRTTETVARIAERTFAVLVDQVTSEHEVAVLARKMQGAIALPITIDHLQVFMTSRIGVALSSCDNRSSHVLLDAAARALEAARANRAGISGLKTMRGHSSADPASTIAA